MPSRFARTLIVCLAAMALTASTASAATTKTKTVPGTVVFAHGQKAGKPGSCSAIVFVQWTNVPNTISARAFFKFQGQERSESRAAPFDDHYEWVAIYDVPPGAHWIQVSQSWRNGSKPSTCEDLEAKNKTIIGTEARVELTIAESKACTNAKRNLTRRRAKVKSLEAALARATTKRARARLRAKLASARKLRNSAAKTVKRVC